jgi:rhamnose transport system permease protein
MSAYKREISIAAAYLLLLAVLAVFAPRFYQGDKLLNILVASAPILVAAVGMTLVILSRNIDISIGSQLSICGVVAGLLAKSGLPMPIIALVTTDAISDIRKIRRRSMRSVIRICR